jgi:hypothetical protein
MAGFLSLPSWALQEAAAPAPSPPPPSAVPDDIWFDPPGYIYAPLPDNVALDSNSAACAAELARQASGALPTVNTYQFTAKVNVLPADHPLTPVKLDRTETDPAMTELRNRFAAGIPIAPGYEPMENPALSYWDGEYVAIQPERTFPAHPEWKGYYVEVYKLKWNTDTGYSTGVPNADYAQFPLTARYGGIDVRCSWNHGHFYLWTSGPAGTAQYASWGATGTSMPLAGLTITENDILRGEINHAIGLSVSKSAYSQRRWPAQRSDGNDPSNVLGEGMRFRLPAGWTPNPANHPICQTLERAVAKHGFATWDQSSGLLSLRAEPAVQNYFGAGVHGYDILRGFPWGSLQTLAAGDDTTANPLA